MTLHDLLDMLDDGDGVLLAPPHEAPLMPTYGRGSTDGLYQHLRPSVVTDWHAEIARRRGDLTDAALARLSGLSKAGVAARAAGSAR